MEHDGVGVGTNGTSEIALPTFHRFVHRWPYPWHSSSLFTNFFFFLLNKKYINSLALFFFVMVYRWKMGKESVSVCLSVFFYADKQNEKNGRWGWWFLWHVWEIMQWRKEEEVTSTFIAFGDIKFDSSAFSFALVFSLNPLLLLLLALSFIIFGLIKFYSSTGIKIVVL